MIEVSLIIFALAVILIAYLLYSRSQHNYINVLTPNILLSVPLYYVFELGYIKLYGAAASFEAYWYTYLTYSVTYAVFVFVLMRVKVPQRIVSISPPAHSIRYLPYALLALSFLIYLPILMEFREYIFTPRVIYTLTRTGYGLNYFLSSTTANLCIYLTAFQKKAFPVGAAVVFHCQLPFSAFAREQGTGSDIHIYLVVV